MLRNEAFDCEAAVRRLGMPRGVTCSTRVFHRDNLGWSVAVSLRGPGAGGVRETIHLLDPWGIGMRTLVGAYAASVGMRSAGDLPPGAPTTVCAPDDEPERYPRWLAETLAKIEGTPDASEGAKALAIAVVRGLEFDDIPVPSVRAFAKTGAVILYWRHGDRQAELGFHNADSMDVMTWEPEDRRPETSKIHMFRRGQPGFKGFWVQRDAVSWALNRLEVGKVEMFGLCLLEKNRREAA